MTYRYGDRAHTIYKLKDGTRVPSVTTITGVMDKPALVKWANNLGLQGIDSTRYVDALAQAGTLAHYLVERDLMGEQADPTYMREFSPVDVDRAQISVVKFDEWKATRNIVLKEHELELVSEKYRFGGRADLVLDIDDVLTLVDVKTCKALYGDSDDKWAQLAGYYLLCQENGINVKGCAILRIGREASEGFEFAQIPQLETQIKRFLLCRDLYDCQNVLKKSA